MTLEELNRKFARMTVEMRKAVDSDLPKIAGNEAVRLFKQNFREEGFFGKKWEEVQRRQTHTQTYKTKSGKVRQRVVKNAKGKAGMRKILTGATGDLGRSIQYCTEPGRVTVESDLAYSAAHNYGTNDAERSHNVRIPQRQFIGDHPKLREAIREKVGKKMDEIVR